MKSLNIGVSALQSFSKGIDVISDNIANINSVGFKSSRVEYHQSFGDILRRSGASAGGDSPGSNTTTQQIGGGVHVGAISKNFGLGSFEKTGRTTDLSIKGEGFFRVKDSLSGKEFATRAGNFRIDDRGYLVTQSGLRVQGLVSEAAKTTPKYSVDFKSGTTELQFAKMDLPADPATSVGDIRVQLNWQTQDVGGGGNGGFLELSNGVRQAIAANTLTEAQVVAQAPAITSFSVGEDGAVDFKLTNGDSFRPYKILLMQFRDNQALVHENEGLYTGFDAAGAHGFDSMNGLAGTQGLGKISAGELELSNSDLTVEFANLIKTQRSFQAASRIITTSDEIEGELINIKR